MQAGQEKQKRLLLMPTFPLYDDSYDSPYDGYQREGFPGQTTTGIINLMSGTHTWVTRGLDTYRRNTTGSHMLK